ncbi:hypothetical protein ACF5W4_11200 [Bacillota bacterium Lsc_1132]
MKKDIQPLDRLQHVFNDVLQDLESAVKRNWAYWEDDKKDQLREALDAKLETHKRLFQDALTALSAQVILAQISGGVLNIVGLPNDEETRNQLLNATKETLQNMVKRRQPEGDPVPCEYCDGQGHSDVFLGEDTGKIPCIACDGSGVAP